MKISLNTIKSLGYDDVFKLPVDQLVEKIGAQLGALEEEPVNLGALYDGIVVVKVVTCEDHPQADRLHVCMVDDGGVVKDVPRDEQGLVQVVCGAPNVKAGMTVAWLPPGSTVPSSAGKEPFVLEARELRGVVSNGMLASPSELAITDNHDGLLEIIPEEVGELSKPGTPFKQLYGLDDFIIDIENKMFTHRPDCFGLLGVGREIAGIQGLPFKSPRWYNADTIIPSPPQASLKITVRNEIPQEVPRFVAVPMSNITVKPSPVWLQSMLSRHGIRPINNVVDVTNYYMILTGQPLHAYDYDKLVALDGSDSVTLVVRNPRTDEKITLLNGRDVTPRQEAIMIASEKQLIGIGGVMGGHDTEVDDSTKNIVLEAASFDMYSIRRTSMAHGLFTDAVTRFNKGQSPLQNMAVAAKAVEELKALAGGEVAGAIIDDNHVSDSVRSRQSLHPEVKVHTSFINDRLGLDLSGEAMQRLLENVEFRVGITEGQLMVTAPFWRTDIELREDVVEEIGRLYGFDQLPLVLPMRDITPATKDPLLTLKSQIRERLATAGANEVLTYTFVHGDLFTKVGQNTAHAFQLSNAISPELQYYRMSLVPSLLDKVHPNIKAGYDEFALFEIGKTHSLDHPVDDDGLPVEYEFTALVVAANDKLKKPGSAYYQAQKYLSDLCGVELEFKPVSDDMKAYAVVKPYDLNRTALVNIKGGSFLGIIGEFKASVSRQLKLPKYTAGFEVDTTIVGEAFRTGTVYEALPKYPKVNQDITLKVDAALTFQELDAFIWKQLANAKPKNTWLKLDPVSIYQKEDDTDHKNVTLRLTIASYDRTMTDTEVNQLLDSAAAAAQATYHAERI
jgi:phenylalanyl-tRNA synthetase beta chain